jgi:hypothetical protein
MAKKQERKDTPLADSPDVEAPVNDLKSALADINKRQAERTASMNETRAKLNEARIARSKNKKDVAGGSLYGLASFRNTTGREKE